ncbi:DUF898 family protein [Rhodophyticola sp. CCM32]|uniref:DUF898 family protein n=1 Tax=Rhodophyticola sp. CCM32 TaxID=2916397 RepID=UPI00107F8D85|nr:DUF898 family protein [Rhodophyticola sp. CCM32]QBY02317.1 DUF898 family protein [Rhodophyticola sp. CCM32]
MSGLKTEFGGDRGELFQLALKTGLLTALTFGLYRFWQIARFRRWYWSSVRPGGTPMEYTGTGQEKLVGFLFAIILLAIYLALFNVAAMFILIRLSEGPPDILTFGVAATPLSLVPIVFMARYRNRRYILARSRWRGIRFAMSPGAWGYAWRSFMYWVLTILSVGLFWPLMTFQLEKYLTDRSWFGTARFTQFGHFGQLYGSLLPFLVCLWGLVALPLISVQQRSEWYMLAAVYLVLPLTLLFAVYYRVSAFRIMAAMKTLGDGLEFDIYPRTRTLVKIHILGNLLTSLVGGFAAMLILGLAIGILLLGGVASPAMLENPPLAIIMLILASAFALIAVFYNVFRQVFVTFPMVRHVAETLEIHEPALLGTIRQRDRDDMRDAGGFAEALDVGAAF